MTNYNYQLVFTIKTWTIRGVRYLIPSTVNHSVTSDDLAIVQLFNEFNRVKVSSKKLCDRS
ncbi:MAG: hypothetical protein MK111_25090 [Crocosphaera sp.]|uniref:hypothetical protein n=1 Tax=Crocosphaera sp. TaxID=2729996 RepID=UPI00258EF4C3|nr:hypothetical protein [Crocosphaera sp.]MCH2247865.1 hypothetical protein [Crocosphaera sp.]